MWPRSKTWPQSLKPLCVSRLCKHTEAALSTRPCWLLAQIRGLQTAPATLHQPLYFQSTAAPQPTAATKSQLPRLITIPSDHRILCHPRDRNPIKLRRPLSALPLTNPRTLKLLSLIRCFPEDIEKVRTLDFNVFTPVWLHPRAGPDFRPCGKTWLPSYQVPSGNNCATITNSACTITS